MKKTLSLLLFSVLVSLGVAAWGAEKTLKLGVIAELTGDMPAVGASPRWPSRRSTTPAVCRWARKK